VALKDSLSKMNEIAETQVEDEEKVLTEAEENVDSVFDYERPMIHSNINEA
jgi:hypothetical protein